MCSEIVQKDRFKTTTFRTTVSWLFERHSRVLLHIIMRSCKWTLVIGIKHFSKSQVNYFGGIPVSLKRAICCKSRRRFFPRTTSFTARNAGESDFIHLFFIVPPPSMVHDDMYVQPQPPPIYAHHRCGAAVTSTDAHIPERRNDGFGLHKRFHLLLLCSLWHYGAPAH